MVWQVEFDYSIPRFPSTPGLALHLERSPIQPHIAPTSATSVLVVGGPSDLDIVAVRDPLSLPLVSQVIHSITNSPSPSLPLARYLFPFLGTYTPRFTDRRSSFASNPGLHSLYSRSWTRSRKIPRRIELRLWIV